MVEHHAACSCHTPPGADTPGAEALLHELLRSLVRLAGVVLPAQAMPGQHISLSKIFALHELDHEAGLSQRELGQRLGLDKSTVSRLAAELERGGLLTRERDPHNRRLYRLRITPQGSAMHARIAAAFGARYGRVQSRLTPAETEALLVGLPGLLRLLEQELFIDDDPQAEVEARPGPSPHHGGDAPPP